MTESSDCNFAQIGRHKSIGILVKIAALTLVVRNVAGVSAVGKLFFHLGQMVGADMRAFIATDVAGII